MLAQNASAAAAQLLVLQLLLLLPLAASAEGSTLMCRLLPCQAAQDAWGCASTRECLWDGSTCIAQEDLASAVERAMSATVANVTCLALPTLSQCASDVRCQWGIGGCTVASFFSLVALLGKAPFAFWIAASLKCAGLDLQLCTGDCSWSTQGCGIAAAALAATVDPTTLAALRRVAVCGTLVTPSRCRGNADCSWGAAASTKMTCNGNAQLMSQVYGCSSTTPSPVVPGPTTGPLRASTGAAGAGAAAWLWVVLGLMLGMASGRA